MKSIDIHEGRQNKNAIKPDFIKHRAFENAARESKRAWAGLARRIAEGGFNATERGVKTALALFEEAFVPSASNPYAKASKGSDRQALASSFEQAARAGVDLSRKSPAGVSTFQIGAGLMGLAAHPLIERGILPWEDWPMAKAACETLKISGGLEEAAAHLLRESMMGRGNGAHFARMALIESVGMFAKHQPHRKAIQEALAKEAASMLAKIGDAGPGEGERLDVNLREAQGILGLAMNAGAASEWLAAARLKSEAVAEEENQRQAWMEAAAIAVERDADKVLSALMSADGVADYARQASELNGVPWVAVDGKGWGLLACAVKAGAVKCAQLLIDGKHWGRVEVAGILDKNAPIFEALMELALVEQSQGREWLAAACLDCAKSAIERGHAPEEAAIWIESCLGMRAGRRKFKPSAQSSRRERIILDIGLMLNSELGVKKAAAPKERPNAAKMRL